MRLMSDMVFQHLHQARFANARLAAEQHHLPATRGGLCPAPLQQGHFFVPAHQRGQPRRGDDVEAALDAALVQDTIHVHQRRDTSEGVRAQRLSGKVPLDEPEGGLTDHHRIGRHEPLEAGGQTGCFTQSQLFLAAATAHLTHHHQPGMHPQAHRQVYPALRRQTRIELAHSLDHTQPSTDGPLGVVFMGLRIAKVD
jgi:hypothetical protein